MTIIGKRTLAAILLLFLTGCAWQHPRGDQLINNNWKFLRSDASGAEAISFDDSAWRSVTLPHTWNNLDGQDGGDNFYQGTAWYRRKLFIGSEESDRRIVLKFDGACLVTDVFVNGTSAGRHSGGFAAFCFDVTDLLHRGENVLAVRVNNSRRHFPEVPPTSGDFTLFGGLYRDVHLLSLDPLSISPMDDGSSGVYLKQSHVDRTEADVEITTKLRNASKQATGATVICTITDANGWKIARAQVDQPIPASREADAVTHVQIAKPHLWDGLRDPYLYRATVEVKRGGKIVDRIEQPLGLRFFDVDPNRGFLLNGKPYALHGVNVHQDYLDKGWAIGTKEIDENYRLIHEIGATVVRLAHYQHPEYEYSLCDRSGIVVWAELAMVNRPRDTAAFAENAKQQLRELIKQNYNHPSICFWSLYNEPNFASDDPAHWRLFQELNELAHQIDPDRLTTGAVSQQMDHPANWLMDIASFNRYWGWYIGSEQEWPSNLDAFHAAYPNRGIAISEYGAGASIAQHEPLPSTRPIPNGRWHPEEWQATVHELAYGAMKQRPWLWGTFVWAMFDFASDSRDEGDHAGRNDKGLVTMDRKTRKDAFYFYKANWSSEPFTYITSRRFTPRPSGRAEAKIYSNCDSVELLVNGRSQGKLQSEDHIFLWHGIELHEGTVEIRAVGRKGGWEYTDRCQWIISPSAPPAPAVMSATTRSSPK